MESNLHFYVYRHGGAVSQGEGPIFVALYLIKPGESWSFSFDVLYKNISLNWLLAMLLVKQVVFTLS